MLPPLISFVTFNRAGLNARNLTRLLETHDDFELYIVDNHSSDDTWKFIERLKDSRIKCKKRFNTNRGLIYALNFVLSHRKKEQYFVTIDSDVYIETDNWIPEFIKAFHEFPELGVVGAERPTFFNEKKIEPKVFARNGFEIYKLTAFVGCCMCIRPEVFDLLGYFNEETYGADVDLFFRLNKYTNYEAGILPSIKLNQLQKLPCEQCIMKDICSLNYSNSKCINIYVNKYKHIEFAKLIREKLEKYNDEIKAGKRTAYCASIHDPKSLKNNYYNKKWAEENFAFFIKNTN